MKCKYCGKKGVQLSHFMRAHKALMIRKSAEGRRKAFRGKSKKSPANPRPKSRSHAEKVVGWHYCPMCGRRCG